MPTRRSRDDGRFGAWLTGELRQRGWSQSELARRMATENRKFSASVVNRWLRQGRLPEYEPCQLLAVALGLELDFVLAKAGLPPREKQAPTDLYAESLIGMVRKVNWTNPTRRESVAALLNHYATQDRKGGPLPGTLRPEGV